MKKIFVALCIMVLSTAAFSQQEPLFEQYRFNMLVINPAYAGVHGITNMRLGYRDQWVAFTGAPKTFIGSVDGTIKNKLGIGGLVFNDVLGVEARTGAQLCLNYHIKLGDGSKGLSVGIGARAMQWKINQDRANPSLPDDPAIVTKDGDMLFDASAGAHFYSENTFIGLAVPQLFQITGSDAIDLAMHLYLYGGHRFQLSENFSFEPSAMIKYVQSAPVQFDISAKAYFLNETLYFGAGYRHASNVIVMVGYTFDNFLHFGYAYNFSFDDLQTYSSGSHELMLGFDLVRTKSNTEKPEVQ